MGVTLSVSRFLQKSPPSQERFAFRQEPARRAPRQHKDGQEQQKRRDLAGGKARAVDNFLGREGVKPLGEGKAAGSRRRRFGDVVVALACVPRFPSPCRLYINHQLNFL